MLEIVYVRYGVAKLKAEFVASQLGLRVGERCVISTDRGVELGVVLTNRQVDNINFADARIHKALRKATERDLLLYEKKKLREESAYRLCQARIKARKLKMKLSRVEHIFDGSRVIFYFTANSRVDFRVLVRDLAHELKTRIEMRQIGARDEAQMLGGLGSCGTRENCSAAFLTELRSVPVRAVKQQSLGMNSNRLSGTCGRLKCCLNFEIERPRRDDAPGSCS